MFHRLLVATDGTPVSRAALSWGRLLAETSGAELLLASVVGPSNKYQVVTSASIARRSSTISGFLRSVSGRLARSGVVARPVISYGSAAEQIGELVRVHKADLIVMGQRRRSFVQGLLRPSVGDQVLDHTNVPVLIAKRGPTDGEITIGADDSPAGRKAVRDGMQLAGRLHMGVRVVRVIAPPEIVERAARRPLPWRWIEGLSRAARESAKCADHIIDAARRSKSSLIVVGSRGHHRVSRIIEGSVSRRVVHRAPSAVLVVRA